MKQFQYGAPHSSGVACNPVIWCILLELLYLRDIFIRKGRKRNNYHENKRCSPIKSSYPAFVNPCFTALFLPYRIIKPQYHYSGTLTTLITLPNDIFRVIQDNEALVSVKFVRALCYTPYRSVYCSQM